MTQPRLTREPEDGRIERWLTERERQLPPPDRAAVLGGALERLPHTPQRRRWRLLRWLPFGIGATRSSVPAEPRIEGRTNLMLNATRMVALMAIVAVGGSLALVAGPLASGPTLPGAEIPGPEVAVRFNGTGSVNIDDPGTKWSADGVGHLRGQVSTMPAKWIEVDDPRAGGTATFTQHADDYGGFGPTWGTMRIEDEEGVWVGEVSGTHGRDAAGISGWLTGEGAYEGLVLYYHVRPGISAVGIPLKGAIFPADVLPLDSDLAPPTIVES